MIKSITSELHRALAAKLFALDKWRVGQGAMVSYLRDFQKSQFGTLEQTRAQQLNDLRKIVAYAVENCPYYANCFSQLGLSAESLQSLDDLASFPILEKSDIQQNQAEMISRSWPKSDLIANHTGGSTGEPLPLHLNLDRRCQRDAGAWRHNEWAGARLGDKISYVWGAVFDLPTDSIKTRLRNWLIDRTLYLNSGDLTEQNMLEFYATLQRFRPASMIAYARSLALVARFFKQRGLTPPAFKGIITSAETLSDDDRAVIEEVFQAKVFNRYGCREVSVIASECEQHDGLHTMAECLVVEVVDADGRPSPPGEMGSIVVTDLFNYAMPLIRYRVGDMGAIKAGECPCGRGLPMLERIEGRVTDFLVGKDGRLVSGVYVATYLIGKCPQLGRVQVLQESPGQLLFKVTGASTPSDAQFIVETSKKMLGDDVEVEIEQVDEIPRTRSGKLVLCRSNATVDYLQTADSAGVVE